MQQNHPQMFVSLSFQNKNLGQSGNLTILRKPNMWWGVFESEEVWGHRHKWSPSETALRPPDQVHSVRNQTSQIRGRYLLGWENCQICHLLLFPIALLNLVRGSKKDCLLPLRMCLFFVKSDLNQLLLTSWGWFKGLLKLYNAVWDGCRSVSYRWMDWMDWIGNLRVGWSKEQLTLLRC